MCRSICSTAHPRSRGENTADDALTAQPAGSSPLTRGKQGWRPQVYVNRRLIPAHAGKTDFADLMHQVSQAHPRSRGENLINAHVRRSNHGSSPLTRGKLAVVSEGHGRRRLIPAHAGKTCPGPHVAAGSRAHPRSRGENSRILPAKLGCRGSSPLTRGKPPRVLAYPHCDGLIPAHAGKTLPDLRFYCADRSDLGNP